MAQVPTYLRKWSAKNMAKVSKCVAARIHLAFT